MIGYIPKMAVRCDTNHGRFLKDKIMEKKLLQGDMITLIGEENEANIWFSNTTKRFCLELNAKCLLSLKTFKSFRDKANKILKRNGIVEL